MSNNNIQRKEDVVNESLIKSLQDEFVEKVRNAVDIQILDNIPVPVPSGSGVHITFITSEPGLGKSLLARAIMNEFLKKHSDIAVIYIDLEFSYDIAKERGFDLLVENHKERFFVIHYDNVFRIINSKNNILTGISFLQAVERVIEYFSKQYKKFVVFIDTFEALVSDTSDDDKVKKAISYMYSLSRDVSITYIINHHVPKDKLSSFRGSMIIKATSTSMITILKKTNNTDFEISFECKVEKVRFNYPPVRELVVGISSTDGRDWIIKNTSINSDFEEIKILKSIYFILKDKTELSKTELINNVVESAGKGHMKVREVLEKNKEFFNITRGKHNTYFYTINLERIDELEAVLGINHSLLDNLSENKRKLLDILKQVDDDNINITIKTENNSVIEYKTKQAILYDINNMSDDIAKEIVNKLSTNNIELDYDDDAIDF